MVFLTDKFQRLNMNKQRIEKTGIKVIALMLVASSSQAANLVTNGSFEQTTIPAGTSALVTNSNLTGWQTTSGYTALVAPGQAGVSYGSPNDPSVWQGLWANTNGGLDAIPATSPDGGNFLASDSAWMMGTTYQTLTNLVAGQKYAVSLLPGCRTVG